MTRFIFITGGVVSSLGKGLTSCIASKRFYRHADTLSASES
jgi:CTP synthase (UTP-ammonia lyase)